MGRDKLLAVNWENNEEKKQYMKQYYTDKIKQDRKINNKVRHYEMIMPDGKVYIFNRKQDIMKMVKPVYN